MEQQKWDIAVLFDVLEHSDNPFELLKTLSHVLKDTGYICITVPNRESPKFLDNKDYDYPPYHLTRWSQSVLKKFLESNRFTVEKIIIKPFLLKDVSDVITNQILVKLVFWIKKVLFTKKGLNNYELRFTSFESLSSENDKIIFLKNKTFRKFLVNCLNMMLFFIFSPLILPIFCYFKITNAQGATIFVMAKKI